MPARLTMIDDPNLDLKLGGVGAIGFHSITKLQGDPITISWEAENTSGSSHPLFLKLFDPFEIDGDVFDAPDGFATTLLLSGNVPQEHPSGLFDARVRIMSPIDGKVVATHTFQITILSPESALIAPIGEPEITIG